MIYRLVANKSYYDLLNLIKTRRMIQNYEPETTHTAQVIDSVEPTAIT